MANNYISREDYVSPVLFDEEVLTESVIAESGTEEGNEGLGLPNYELVEW